MRIYASFWDEVESSTDVLNRDVIRRIRMSRPLNVVDYLKQ
jgi:hypothetical protein